MKLDVNNISKYFGEGSNKKKAIDEVSFSISSGEFKTLVGSSGSGKSTILRIIAGLENPSKGNVKVDGKVVHGPGLDRGMVFQKYSLFPWLTAEENIAFGMNLNSYKLKEIKYRTSYLLEVVGLQDSASKYPKELSGGMQQRVGLARALATDSDIMLMDEAFSALDPLIRSDMQKQLIDLQSELKKTIVFITHDLDESLRLGDHIGILNGGRLVQVGTPIDIIMNPADDYVEAFVKDVNRAKVIKAKIIMTPASSSNDVDKSNLIKVQEDQFLDEFLPKVVCSNANCEVVDKSGNVRGYLTQKELSKALTKEHMADAAKSN